jgi:acetoin:2,6-dichlorophenolindophenol oxidoreductase subunit alpha
LSPNDLQSTERLFRTMARIRAFEERVSRLYADSLIPGFVHLCIGQEAVAAGVAGRLLQNDQLTTSHRGHGHVIAKGGDLGRMMAELLGRESGYCRGRGGSMHIMNPAIGVLGANGIVGAGLPLAVGAALTAKLVGSERVVACFFGEGALNQGMAMEAMNLAAIWNLALLFVCENNLFAEFTDSRSMSKVSEASVRAAAFGIPACQVDGNDAVAVDAAAAQRIDACRNGDGPQLLEAMTYRHHGHYEGDSQAYKEAHEDERWTVRDPLIIGRGWFTDPTVPDALIGEGQAEVDEAVAFATASPYPLPEEAGEDVYA